VPERRFPDKLWQLISATAWFTSFLEDLARECAYIADPQVKDEMMISPTNDDAELFGSAPRTSGFRHHRSLTHTTAATPLVETNPTTLPLPAGPSSRLENPTVLLHLIHPYLLKNMSDLISHVTRLKQQVSQSTATTPNARLAKEIYMEQVASLGVDLEALLPILADLSEGVSRLDGEHQSMLPRTDLI
jgi:hypothetical protein